MLSRSFFVFALLALVVGPPSHLRAQGSLTPPGAPAPTQKSLQEIWDKLAAVEARASLAETENHELRTEVASLTRAQQFLLKAGFSDRLPWQLSSVTSPGALPSLAFGPDGRPAIAFRSGTNTASYAHFNGTAWTITAITTGSPSAFSLAFGADGRPAMAFVTGVTPARLNFARHDGNSWQLTTIETGSTRVYKPSLAIAPNGDAAIAYATDDEVRLARLVGGAWTSTKIADVGNGFQAEQSLAFRHDGTPAVAFVAQGNNRLRFAQLDGETWRNDRIDDDGRSPSLVFDRTGMPTIAYSSGFSVRLARAIGVGSWDNQLVEANIVGDGWHSLAFGPDGRATIAYGSRFAGLRLAQQAANGWVISAISRIDSNAPAFGSLAFGPDGLPAVAFQEIPAVRFARQVMPSF